MKPGDCSDRGCWWEKGFALLVMLGGVAAVLVACVKVERTAVVPPHVPGASFVGSEECSTCHEEITSDFPTATHAMLTLETANTMNIGCESCHGPASIHTESGGAPRTIINPKRDPGSCFQCHLDVRASFHLPHSHPVLEEKISCGDCHDPHRGPAIKAGADSLMSRQENCVECHQAQKGPFVFEHEATREGCTTCHQPHGSVNAKLLRERNSTACTKCHPVQQTSGGVFIGGFPHEVMVQGGASRLSRGACWSAGCHEAVHGSQVSSSLRF